MLVDQDAVAIIVLQTALGIGSENDRFRKKKTALVRNLAWKMMGKGKIKKLDCNSF